MPRDVILPERDPEPMSRRAKLQHLRNLIEAKKPEQINLDEFMEGKRACIAGWAFRDATFKAMGLKLPRNSCFARELHSFLDLGTTYQTFAPCYQPREKHKALALRRLDRLLQLEAKGKLKHHSTPVTVTSVDVMGYLRDVQADSLVVAYNDSLEYA